MLRSFFRELNIQRRVIAALLIREIYYRFGREGIGFAWLIAEPLMFALPVLLLWSIVRAKYEHGILMMGMVITGYLPILLFRHLGGTMILFVRGCTDLLYHRQITLLDIFIARCVLEIVSNITALVITFALFISLGDIGLPRNLPMFYLGYFFMTWWCVAIAMLVGTLTERSKWIEKIWPVYSYTYMFFSGFFFLADWLPAKLRAVALYQPSFQAYEMIRAGMFGSVVKTYGDPRYTTVVLGILTVLGLWLLRDARKNVTVE